MGLPMRKNDTSPFLLRDIALALGLLSRLPVPLSDAAYGRTAQAAWAFPIVGAVLATLSALMGGAAIWLGLAPQAAAVLTLGSAVMLSGGMHEDGLADSADGLWGGWNQEDRLRIMKDSHIGSYGVIALILVLGAQGWALSSLFTVGLFDTGGAFWALLAAAMLSRTVLPVLMYALPPARDHGLAQAQGRPAPRTVVMAGALGSVGAVLALGWGAVALCALTAVIGCGLGILARRKIGGHTGDILGATQKLSEVAILVVLAS